jgi:hypothetical protein
MCDGRARLERAAPVSFVLARIDAERAANLRTVAAAMTSRARILIAASRAFVLVFGLAALWLARDGLNPDGVAYLDASDVYLSGSSAAGTGYWSPLYPMLLAGARFLAGTGAARELAIAQGVNLAVFVLAFVALKYLVREARQATERRRRGAPSPNETVWLVLVYALFAVATVGWIRVGMMTPDMCVAAIVLASAGVGVRLTTGRAGWGATIVLGALLGLGFLAKAAMFPIALVVVGTLAVMQRRNRGLLHAIVAGGVFLAIAAPQIVYVSRLKGSPTFGDVGRLNYLWFVANVPGPVSSSFPLPSRLPSPTATAQTLTPLDSAPDTHPAVYDIDAPIPGTLPIWYDAGYWYRGVTAPLLPGAIVRTFVRHARVYLEMFGFLLVGGVAAALAAPARRRDLRGMRPSAMLVVPALAALGMYALVLVQSRYVAPFALLLFPGLVPPWATDAVSRRLRVGFAAGAVACIPLVAYQARVDGTYWRGSAEARANVAAALAERGIGSGTRVGFIGEAYDAMWARTARVRFVSLVPLAEAPRFWALDRAGRSAVLSHMQQRGAGAIVAELPAPGVNIDGWQRLPSAGPPRPELIVYGGLR